LLGNFKGITDRLEQQKAAIDKALVILREFDGGEVAETEKPKSKRVAKAVKKAAKKRAMSEEGRKRISEAAKKRWAAVKKAAKKAA
jgi:pyruvate/2-oxoacid:ferredoxin oxidoreductase beta subunit